MSAVRGIMVPVSPNRSPTMVGREAELAELSSLLGLAGARPGAVLLAGDAGVGKTRLLAELGTVAGAAGWRVVTGHCLDFGDSALPYLPFSEVVGRLAAELPDVVGNLDAVHPVLSRLQPGRRVMTRVPGADHAETQAVDDDRTSTLDRGDLFEAVHAALEAAAAVEPLLLVVEDVHWADRSTRDMLSFLFSRPFAGRVAVVATYRSDDLHRRHPLRSQVAEWARVAGVERLQLGPLPAAQVRALVHALHPGPIGALEVDGIVDRAEGNAFFVEELVGAASGPGRWLPADLADVLLVRLDRLDDHARQVVRAASVAGRRVTHALLAAAVDQSPSELEEALRKAVEMNVLVAQGTDHYAFRHALLGEATYDDLLPGERVRLHARYADALRDGRGVGTAAELARHARLAMDYDTALDAGIRAGAEAMSVGGPDEAAQHYQQALELLADPRRRVDADLDLSKLVANAADALSASGHPARAAALIQEQLARLPEGSPDAWRSRLLSARAALLDVIEPDEDPLLVSTEAVRLLPPEASGLRARVLGVHARILGNKGRYDEAQGVGLDAFHLAEGLDLHVLASDALTTLSGLKRAGPKDALRAALVEAVSRAESSGALLSELRGRFLLGRSFQDWAEFEGAERWFRSGVERGEAAGVPWAPYAFECRWQLGWVLHAQGRWSEELALLDVRAPSPPPVAAALLDVLRLQVAAARGDDVTAALAPLRRHWTAEGLVAIQSSTLEIELAGARGDARGAIAVYDDAVGVLVGLWHEWFSARLRLAAATLGAVADAVPSLSTLEREGLLVEVTRVLGDGRTVRDRFQDPAGFWGPEGRAWAQRLEAEAHRVCWLLGGAGTPEPDVLIEAWVATVDAFDVFGHVHETARAQAVLAAVLRASGDPASARDMGDRARATARALGAQPLLDRLRASGSEAQRTRDGSEPLTPREREILGLVAQGRSNGEIGKQLFISTKTVSVHVSHILAKLGAAGRTEAAALARQRGLLDQ